MTIVTDKKKLNSNKNYLLSKNNTFALKLIFVYWNRKIVSFCLPNRIFLFLCYKINPNAFSSSDPHKSTY